ncbi:carbon-nitrogen hydrolase family protein [Fulvivirgaceae bacterium BMA12]|uniref:Carbon-nitrogen hydrolase family protein n=1 Tax=Agaribacillus aureus TaxID=3051825 RepID=A0ABT8LEH8_9BACT|nr:carbon-nitrogen hydrolase family protein [Fulvivirgaceae bacterium BMA12]
MMNKTINVAIVQHSPVYLDLNKSLEKSLDLVQEAADNGAEIIVFGETWLSGYPAWLDYCPEVAQWNYEPAKEVFSELFHNSVQIPGPEISQLCQAAKNNKVVICMGLNETTKSGKASGTIFNTLLTINEKGQIANHHRKLMPTYTEKLVYGMGDGMGLHSVETAYGRINGLICWEHWMPLARQAMHDSDEQIHVAVWPTVHEMHQIASRQYAFEGRCFVLAAGQILKAGDLPSKLTLPPSLEGNPDKMILNGGSCVIGPDGKYMTAPVFDQETILFQEINLDEIYKEKMTLDVSGHYQRPDVFTLSVNKQRNN